jgi:hypothetical protein
MPSPQPTYRNAGPSHDGASAEQIIPHLHMWVMNDNWRKALVHVLSVFPPFSDGVNSLGREL